MPALAERLERAQVVASTQIAARARELRRQGANVISLAIGEPDFASPPHAIEAAHQAALRGDTKYPPQDGTIALKEAIQRKFRRENDLNFDLDQILVSNGGKQAIFSAFMATLNDGDEVVIPAPYWAAYPLIVKLIGGVPVFVPGLQANGFKPRPEDIEAAITPRTKWLALNFPNNPSGADLTRDEWLAIAAVMERHPDVWILSDDIYEHLTFGGFKHTTLAQVAPGLRDRTLTLSGVSKTYAMTGWRIGFTAGPKHLIRAMTNVQGHATAGISTIGQAAAVAALDGSQDAVGDMVRAYQRRRDLVVARLNQCDGIQCHKPEGAFYVFPDIGGCLGRTTQGGRMLATDQDFAHALLEEQYVGVVHGGAFGMSPHLRISYATDDASLEEACRRIQTFTAALR